MSINVYTGSLNYQNAEYQFVFHDDELHLIPPPEVAENILWSYERKEIAPGVYTSGDPLRMKESVLVGRCRENNKYIFFLVRKNAQLGCQNDVLIVPLIAHFMCHNSKPFISRICFYGPELNHIHPVNQALCYTLDADHFFNDGTFSLATRSHEFTTTSKQQFLVDGNNVTVSFDIRRDFSSKISDAPVHLNSALTFEFDPSDNYMFLLRLYNIAKRFIQFLCYRVDINISTTNLYELTDDDKYSNIGSLHIRNESHETDEASIKAERYIRQKDIAGLEGKILGDIAEDRLYLRHIPDSYKVALHINAARFVMITAAFEWEFRRLYPDGIPKSTKRLEAEHKAEEKLNELIENCSGDTKRILKFVRRAVSWQETLQSKVEKVGHDLSDTIDIFGQQLYSLNGEVLNYSEMGKRLADQRNNYAHGNLDKEFIGNSLLDLVYLQRIVYAMQLSYYGIECRRVQQAVNQLFRCNLVLP